MIISHKYKFIFVKPSKVAGTSIEIALGKYCGDEDIITPITEYNPQSDSFEYEHPAKNYEKLDYYNHITPEEIKERIGEKIWNEYYKFTIVRNPWDQMVSQYFWKRRKAAPPIKREISPIAISKILRPKSYMSFFDSIRKRLIKSLYSENDFERFFRYFKNKWTSTRYYFDEKGNPICDYYIRFENLNGDYKEVCQILGIPFNELPMTKNKQRKEKKHYSEFYTPKAKRKVEQIFKKEIEYFKYTFKP